MTGQSAAIAEVQAALHDCVAAYSTDLERYFSYYADDMLMSVPDAGITMTKQDYHDYWKQHEAAGFGAAGSRIEDLKIWISPSGDAAGAYFAEPTVLRFPEGHEDFAKGITHSYLTTATLFKRDGEWKIVTLSVVTRDDGPQAAI